METVNGTADDENYNFVSLHTLIFWCFCLRVLENDKPALPTQIYQATGKFTNLFFRIVSFVVSVMKSARRFWGLLSG